MAQVTKVWTDTTLTTPASWKLFAMYPSKEHCDYDDLESAILSAISVSNIPSAIDATKIADGSVSNTEFQYLNWVTSAIQTQLDWKLSDITWESIWDLSDVDTTWLANWNVLAYNSTSWNFEPSSTWAWDVIWPASSTDNAIARFDSTTWKILQNSWATVDDSGNLTANNVSWTNTWDVTLAGTPDYITITGQTITRNQIDLTADVTGDLPFSNITQIAPNRILGRSTAGTGDIEALADWDARTIMWLATTDSPQFAEINLWHATDTTISRVSAWVIAVEWATLATQAYAEWLFASNDAMLFKWVIDCSTNPNYPAADAWHLYKISVAWKIGWASWINVEVWDSIICAVDSTASWDQATVWANRYVIQVNLDGAVIWPASSTDWYVVLFDGTTGKLIKNSTINPTNLLQSSDIWVSVQAYDADTTKNDVNNTFTGNIQTIQNASNPRLTVDTWTYTGDVGISTWTSQFVTWDALADMVIRAEDGDLVLATRWTSRRVWFYTTTWWDSWGFNADWEMLFNYFAWFDAEVDDWNSGTADTIDWWAWNAHKSTMTWNCTYTFTAPAGVWTLTLKLVQDATGGRTATRPATVKRPWGTAPTLSTWANAIDIITFYYDWTNYFGVDALNFS